MFRRPCPPSITLFPPVLFSAPASLGKSSKQIHSTHVHQAQLISFHSHFFFTHSFKTCYSTTSSMARDRETLPLKGNKPATFRLCNVSSYTTELLELRAENPSFHVLFIPGNPGVVSFYKEFVERVYEMLQGRASITAIGHVGHTMKNWEQGKLFSLQEQIDHKVDFIKQEIQTTEVPLLLVGHSIGSYISLGVFRRTPEQVKYCIGLYPFLCLNKDSMSQRWIGKIAASQVLSVVLSSVVGALGFFPSFATSFLVRRSLGKSWSATAVGAVSSHLLQYHTMRNILYMAKKEFEKLAEVPDWNFIRENQDQVAFLFGIDDHWGPISLFEEISKEVPGVPLTIEREGHTHGFCCTQVGSVWVADHVVSLIKNQFESKPMRSD